MEQSSNPLTKINNMLSLLAETCQPYINYNIPPDTAIFQRYEKCDSQTSGPPEHLNHFLVVQIYNKMIVYFDDSCTLPQASVIGQTIRLYLSHHAVFYAKSKLTIVFFLKTQLKSLFIFDFFISKIEKYFFCFK